MATVCCRPWPSACAMPCVRVTRWPGSGDFFVILCENALPIRGRRSHHRAGQRALLPPVFVEDVAINVGMSVGIAIAQGPGHTAEDMIRKADTAMCAPKDKGRGCATVMYGPEMGAAAPLATQGRARPTRRSRRRRPAHLYQPVIDLRDSRVIVAEALVRWRHPDAACSSRPSSFPSLRRAGSSSVSATGWLPRRVCRLSAGGRRFPTST